MGLYGIGKDLFSRTAGFLAALIYIACPYMFFFDRLALVDGLVSAFGIWMVRWSFHIVHEKVSLDRGFLVLGVLMGAALLTKATALLLFPLPPVIFYLWRTHQKEQFWIHGGIGCAVILAMNLPVLLGGPDIGTGGRIPFLHRPGYFIAPSVLLAFPWEIWYRNLVIIREFLVSYMTLPLSLVLMASLVYLFTEHRRAEKVLWFWFLFPILVILVIANGFFSRYFVMMIPAAILLIAAACDRLSHFIIVTVKKLAHSTEKARMKARAGALAGLMFLVLFNAAALDLALIHRPEKAPIHPLDRMLYIEGMNSGYGVREAADFLANEARDFRERMGYPLPVMLPMSPGNPPQGVTVYLWDHPAVRLVPAYWWPESPRLIPGDSRFTLRPSIYHFTPKYRREISLLNRAYFIYPYTTYPKERFLKENPEFQLDRQFKKLDPNLSVSLYRHHPKPVEMPE
ncbi:MAG: hypothetical protein GWM98_06680 [Nitrospinaceae bacterium]|nr:hypothetical protein [Nitrospinaceae bacterium]NIR54239.1 hypothetical protein [Nitrospinaceae bacterium]NIS84656.1 hypothetical protein [Nitrospinaceae bacterium]NIT81451.1 hypothetical protein [Nitrospinaceae bacterium]NIU43734.1 hypothetical protein [Nitrospinaceae bacterium]